MNDRNNLVSSFPAPPIHYISQCTDSNIKDNLILPPPPPIQGAYTMFGVQYNTEDMIIQPLENQGIRRLYPNTPNFDRKVELKKLNHSIIANFLDLLEILIRCPSSPERERKIEDLSLLFINFHHLVNEFRPHQACQSLMLMLERQYKERMCYVNHFRDHFQAVEENLSNCLDNFPDQLEIKFLNDPTLKKIWIDCMQKSHTKRSESEKSNQIVEMKIDPEDIALCHLADKIVYGNC
ncbi:Mediator of RNA polymerase II transcription subunit 7 [Trichinella papuae]|uniref:Mediator of RNA polymerase II transcription subunit 7 n=1 Tax=Trichinella papuae TaxID=268474 RepID=A0A0V1N744_9BILA|nr:Mediator of RNA polymerase II transcription subunit 7 [Trichinella papuae]